MKDKIRQQLQETYAGAWKKLTPKAQELLVDKLAAKVTTDEELQNAISGLESSPIPFADYVELIQSEADRRVSEAVTKAKQTPPESTQGQQQQSTSQTTQTDSTPEWAKALMDKVTKLESEKHQTSLQQKLKAKLPDVPDSYLSRAGLPASEEELDTFAESIKTEFTALKQELINSHAGSGNVPLGTHNTSAIDADIAAWAKQD